MSIPPRVPSSSLSTARAAEEGPAEVTVARPHPDAEGREHARLELKPSSDQVNAAFLERQKNEIVNAMLVKIKPFVGSTGSIQPDVDFDRLGKVMEDESEFLGRTLILTILLSSTAEPVKGGDESKAIVFLLCDRITRSSLILGVLQKWLTDAAKAGEPDCHLSLKVLELLGRLHLNVEHLVQYKYGKLVKKILGREDCITTETKRKAQELYDRWSELAKSEEGSRRSSADSQTRRPSTAVSEVGPVENPGLFSDHSAPKTRAAMILERAARGQAAPKAVARYTLMHVYKYLTGCRPMSADDIHKAKKRRQYLQEAVASGQAAPEELEQLGLLLDHPASPPPPPPPPPSADIPLPNHTTPNTVELNMDREDRAPTPPTEVSPRTGKPKKRVTFAREEDLVQVHYFDMEEEEQPMARKSSFSAFKAKKKGDYHHADKQEASYAFNRLRIEMEAEIEWQTPVDITITDENIAPAMGEESEERQVQEQRERQAVSAVYFSMEHVPPSPAESEQTLYEQPSKEPVWITASTLQPQKIVIADARNPPIDPKVLASFMHAPPPFPPPPGMPPMVPPPMPLPGMPNRPMMIPPLPFPLPRAPAAGGISVFPPFPPPGIGLPGAPRPPFPFPMPNAGMPRPPLPPGMFLPMPPMPMQVPGQAMPSRPFKTRACKFYQSGQPGSCRFGDNCSFYHQDY